MADVRFFVTFRCATSSYDSVLRRHRLSRLAAPAGPANGSRTLWKTPLAQLTGYAGRRSTASGRTDAGVHALGQVVHFLTVSQHSTETFVRALNAILPDDVRVLAAEEKPQAFHATLDAKSKRLSLRDRQRHDRRRVSTSVLLARPSPLDEDAMARAGRFLLGRHDFQASRPNGPTARAVCGPSST